MSPATKDLFVAAEGVELMVLILRQKRRARSGALKALVSLDHLHKELPALALGRKILQDNISPMSPGAVGNYLHTR